MSDCAGVSSTSLTLSVRSSVRRRSFDVMFRLSVCPSVLGSSVCYNYRAVDWSAAVIEAYRQVRLYVVVPAAGQVFHYSPSQAPQPPPPAVSVIDLIGDVLQCRQHSCDVVCICRHYRSALTSPAAVAYGTSLQLTVTAHALPAARPSVRPSRRSRRRRVNVFIAARRVPRSIPLPTVTSFPLPVRR